MTAEQYRRVEPSPRYDGQASDLLGRAYAVPKRWSVIFLRRPRPGPKTAAWLAANGIALFDRDQGGLAAWQRAFVRSLYYCHNGGANGRRNPVWSLQVRWGREVNLRGQAGREVAVRVLPVADAQAYASRQGKASAWPGNRDLQSGGEGSTKKRFA